MPLVLTEPFNDFTTAPWTLTGTPTIVAGRTGTAMSSLGTTNRADYSIAAPLQTDTFTIGFAWRTNTVTTNIRETFLTYTDTNTAQQHRLVYNGTTAQSFSFLTAGVTLGTTATGLVPVNTWAYIEVSVRMHDTLGTAIVRVNGVEQLNLSGVDTHAVSTKTTLDTVRLFPNATGVTCLYDDLYLRNDAIFTGDPALGTNARLAQIDERMLVRNPAPEARLAQVDERILTFNPNPVARLGQVSLRALTRLGITDAKMAAISLRALIAGPFGVYVRVWDGSSFVLAPVKSWNGTAFVNDLAVKTWNGTAYV